MRITQNGDDIIARDERVGRVEIRKLRCLVRPAERRKRPQRRGEPRIQRILILVQTLPSAVRAPGRVLAAHHRLSAVVAIPRRNPVSPPELTRNAPIADIFEPVEINLFKALGHKLRLFLLHGLNGRSRQRLHIHKPLDGHTRFDHRTAAVAGADVVLERLHLQQEALLLQILQNGLAAFRNGHPLILAAQLVHVPVIRRDGDNLQLMTAAHLKVVRIVGRGNLHRSRFRTPSRRIRPPPPGSPGPTSGRINILADQMPCSARPRDCTATAVSPSMRLRTGGRKLTRSPEPSASG